MFLTLSVRRVRFVVTPVTLPIAPAAVVQSSMAWTNASDVFTGDIGHLGRLGSAEGDFMVDVARGCRAFPREILLVGMQYRWLQGRRLMCGVYRRGELVARSGLVKLAVHWLKWGVLAC